MVHPFALGRVKEQSGLAVHPFSQVGIEKYCAITVLLAHIINPMKAFIVNQILDPDS